MKAKRVFRQILGTAVAAVFCANAYAAEIPTDGNPYAFNWSFAAYDSNNNLAYTLMGNGSLSVSGFLTNTLSIIVSLTNTTVDGGTTDGKGARLTSFGIGIEPDAASVGFSDVADGGMVDASLDKIPSLNTIEVCAFGGQNCSGGSNGGIFADGTASGPGSDEFTLTLTRVGGTAWGSSVIVEPIGFKYQTRVGSYEFTTGSTGGPPSEIPEPGSTSLALIGLGLLGASLWSRRRSMHS